MKRIILISLMLSLFLVGCGGNSYDITEDTSAAIEQSVKIGEKYLALDLTDDNASSMIEDLLLTLPDVDEINTDKNVDEYCAISDLHNLQISISLNATSDVKRDIKDLKKYLD